MASISNTHFLNFLDKCNIDLTSCKDLSFDGLCQEKSLQHFLSWICNSFDEDNISQQSSNLSNQVDKDINADNIYDIPESIGDSYDDLFQDIIESLEVKLDTGEKLKEKFVHLDNKLRQKEKCAHEGMVKTEKVLAAAVANCMNEKLEDEINEMYKLCLNTNPYVPNIDLYNKKADKLNTVLLELFKSSVYDVEKFYLVHNTALDPPVTNYEDIALEAQIHDDLSKRQLLLTERWLENLHSVDFQYLLSLSNWEIPDCQLNSEELGELHNHSRRVVDYMSKEREIATLKRKISVNLYLEKTLMENNDLVVDSLIYALFAQSFINLRSSMLQELSTAVDDFFCSISNKCDSINEIVSSCKARSCFLESPPASSISIVNVEVEGMYHELQKCLKIQYDTNLCIRENIGKALQYFRNGPTLRFVFLPLDLFVQFDNCRQLYEKVGRDLRQTVGYYCNVKSKIRSDHDRTQQLMWVFFLTDPTKFSSIQHDYSSFNITFRN